MRSRLAAEMAEESGGKGEDLIEGFEKVRNRNRLQRGVQKNK